jgi:hypothetical protein
MNAMAFAKDAARPVFLAFMFLTSLSAAKVSASTAPVASLPLTDLPADYNNDSVELTTFRKMVDIETAREGFYKIKEIETMEVKDPYHHKPGIRVQIHFETPECENNYYEGTAFSANCLPDTCPVAIVYKKCF